MGKKEEAKKYRLAHPERISISHREYYEKHKEQILAYNREYHQRPEVKQRQKECRNNHIERVRENKKRWVKEHPDKVRESSRKCWQKNKSRYLIRQREYYNENREKLCAYQRIKSKERYQKNKEKILQGHKLRRRKERLECLIHYGGNPPKCACCGELEIRFLTVDHTNNNGAEHRLKIKRINIYYWLKNNAFPEGFQILCFNCNMGKAQNNGVCPHRES